MEQNLHVEDAFLVIDFHVANAYGDLVDDRGDNVTVEGTEDGDLPGGGRPILDCYHAGVSCDQHQSQS